VHDGVEAVLLRRCLLGGHVGVAVSIAATVATVVTITISILDAAVANTADRTVTIPVVATVAQLDGRRSTPSVLERCLERGTLVVIDVGTDVQQRRHRMPDGNTAPQHTHHT
jgi:hypothetical protein